MRSTRPVWRVVILEYILTIFHGPEFYTAFMKLLPQLETEIIKRSNHALCGAHPSWVVPTGPGCRPLKPSSTSYGARRRLKGRSVISITYGASAMDYGCVLERKGV